MIGGALPLIRSDLAMDDAQAGWIIGTAFALPYGVTALSLAVLLRGRQASIGWLVGGVVVWTAASIATGAAHSVASLSLARAGLGIGQAMFVPMAIAWIVGATGSGGRARALSMFTSGSTIGRSAALLTVGGLLSLLALFAGTGAHWRWLFVVTALPNLMLLPLLMKMRAVVSTSATGSVAIAIDWRTLILFFAVAITPVLLIQASSGWLPTLFVRDRGLTAGQAATMLGAVTLFAAPAGQILGGWLMTRFTSWHASIPAIVLASLTATLVPLMAIVWAPGLVGATIGVAAMTLMLGVSSFCGLFGVQILVPKTAHVSVNGIYLALVTLVAVGAGPLLTGALATASGSGTAALADALMTTGLIATGLCAIAVVAVRGRYRRRCAA